MKPIKITLVAAVFIFALGSYAQETDKPATETDKSAMETDKPATETDKSAMETDKPATETDKSAQNQQPEKQEQLTKLPDLVEFIEAEYPASAQAQGVEGEVVMVITVNEGGHVEKVEITKPAGHGFDEAALRAAQQFKFTPAMVGETPVPVAITYRYKFLMKPEEKAAIAARKAEERRKIEEALAAKEIPASVARLSLPVNFFGKVKERGTRAPLECVEVIIKDFENFQTTTNEEGYFEFRGVPPGNHQVSFALMEYEIADGGVNIVEGEKTEITIYLEKLTYNKYSVTVRGKRPKQVVTRHVIEQEEIKKIPGTQGDAIKVIEVMPGVARTPGGLGGMLVFRGGDDGSSTVLVDGIYIPILFHFGGMRSVINSDIISSLEFYPGNFGAEYHHSIAGVVNVQTRRPKDDRLHGKVDVNIYEGGFLFEGPIVEDLSFTAGFHRNWHDLVLKAVWPDDSPAELTVAPRYYDYQLKLHWDINSKHDLELFVFGSDDKLKFLIGEDEEKGVDIGMATGFHDVRLKHIWNINDNFTNTMTPYFSFTKDKESFFSKFGIDLKDYSYGIKENLNWLITPSYQTNFGLDFSIEHLEIKLNAPHLALAGEEFRQTRPTSGRNLDDSYNIPYVGGHVECIAQPIEKLKLIPGVRADYYNYTNNYSVDGRFTARYQLFDWTALKAGVGTYHKEADGAYIIEGYGNPNLNPEWSLQYSAGFEQYVTDVISLDVTGFYVDMRDLVATNPEYQMTPDEPPYINGAEGRSYGMEVMLKHEPSKYFSGWISYTFSKSERLFPEEDWDLFIYDQPHNLAFVGLVRLPYNIEIGARFRLVSGVPTEIIDKRGGYNADGGYYIQSYDSIQKTRMPLVHTLDIRIDKTFVFDWLLWTLYLDVLNVYDNRNKEFVQYNYDFSEYQYVEGLPILPALGTEIKF